jgi:hypothetical protein
LARCLRLLGSDQDGEVVAAVRALKRMLRSGGEDLPDLAARVEKPALNEAEMRKIFDAGVETGIRKAEAAQHGDGEFRAVDGTPRWEDITVWLQRYDDQPID